MMIRRLAQTSIAALLFLPVLVVPGGAAPSPADDCAVAKLHATARLLEARLRCVARATRNGVDTVGACTAKADRRFLEAFERIDGRGGCASTDDAEGILGLSDQLVFALELALRPVLDPNRCAIGKLRALGNRSFAELACVARAIRGREPHDDCIARVSEAFQRAFARAEARGSCLTTGDAESLESGLIPFALLIQTLLGPTPFPTGLAAVIDGGDVALSWTPPSPQSGNTHVKILRRLNTPPEDAGDPAATEVFFGTSATATDPLVGLLPNIAATPRTYHYAAFGCTAAGVCGDDGSHASVAPTLTDVLRAGGYVIHWRHGTANVCNDRLDLGPAATTTSPNWWKSCDATCPAEGPVTATARQLSAAGMADAVAIGDGIRARGIPIGRVLTSEFCRVFTTASSMSFGPTLEHRQDITFSVYDEASRCQNTQDLVGESPAAGTNTAIVGHLNFSCPNLDALAMGEAAIFKPDGSGSGLFLARVLPGEWAGLP